MCLMSPQCSESSLFSHPATSGSLKEAATLGVELIAKDNLGCVLRSVTPPEGRWAALVLT